METLCRNQDISVARWHISYSMTHNAYFERPYTIYFIFSAYSGEMKEVKGISKMIFDATAVLSGG